MVNTTTDLCKLVFQLLKRLKKTPLWGFFIPNKPLELRLHYHFVTLRNGIPRLDNPISLLTINYGLAYQFLLSVLVLKRRTTTQPTYWTVKTSDNSHPESGLGQYYCAALSLCIFQLSSYFCCKISGLLLYSNKAAVCVMRRATVSCDNNKHINWNIFGIFIAL